MSLKTFSGKQHENISEWISSAEEVFAATQLSKDNWSSMAGQAFQGAASTWYYSQKRENNNQLLSWDDLKKAMVEQWDSPARINELRIRLETIPFNYRNTTIAEFTRRFRYIIRMPPDLYVLLLPDSRDKTQPLSHFCTLARNWESLRRLPQKLAATQNATNIMTAGETWTYIYFL